MNTINKETIAQLARVHELRRIELQAEGLTKRICDALGPERTARVCFRNGSEKTLVLGLARLAKWAKLSQSDLTVEITEDNRLRLSEGGGTITLLAHVPSDDDCILPFFTLAASEGNHNGELRLCGESDTKDKLKAAHKIAKEQKRLANIARLRGAEHRALRELRAAATEHCERLSFLASVTLADAIAEARAFRQARRFVRQTLAAFDREPAWLSDEKKPGDYRGPLLSEREIYNLALADYRIWKSKSDNYKPKRHWSSHAQNETEKRLKLANQGKQKVEYILKEAMARHLDGSCHDSDNRTPGDAAWGWNVSKYSRERQYVRAWPKDKTRLANNYISARQQRLQAEGHL